MTPYTDALLARAEAAEARARSAEAHILVCHRALEATVGCLDPEHHAVSAAIDEILRACDEADRCPTYPGATP